MNLASFLDYENTQIFSSILKEKGSLMDMSVLALAPFLTKPFPVINFTFYQKANNSYNMHNNLFVGVKVEDQVNIKINSL